MKRLIYAAMLLLGVGMMVSCGGNGQSKKNNNETANDVTQDTPSVEEVAEPVDKRPRVYSNAFDGFVNIRETPEAKAPVLGVLRNGPEGAVLMGVEGEWTHVDCNGTVGYVLSKHVQNTPTIAVDEGIDMSWLEGWWENNECSSLLIFDNGGFMEYSCMFNEGSFTGKGAFRLQGSSLILNYTADYVNWPENSASIITLSIDPNKKMIVGYEKEQLKTKEFSQYMKEQYGEDEWQDWSYDDLYLTKKDFDKYKKHVFD
ncbi:MAG: SH3 domain-containing protein [Bacteroidales bacterium]|nr:SH3 domain-containing protein [Bacteroidales bacterium]